MPSCAERRRGNNDYTNFPVFYLIFDITGRLLYSALSLYRILTNRVWQRRSLESKRLEDGYIATGTNDATFTFLSSGFITARRVSRCTESMECWLCRDPSGISCTRSFHLLVLVNLNQIDRPTGVPARVCGTRTNKSSPNLRSAGHHIGHERPVT